MASKDFFEIRVDGGLFGLLFSSLRSAVRDIVRAWAHQEWDGWQTGEAGIQSRLDELFAAHELNAVLLRLAAAERLRELARLEQILLINDALERGASWGDVARFLGKARQTAHTTFAPLLAKCNEGDDWWEAWRDLGYLPKPGGRSSEQFALDCLVSAADDPHVDLQRLRRPNGKRRRAVAKRRTGS